MAASDGPDKFRYYIVLLESDGSKQANNAVEFVVKKIQDGEAVPAGGKGRFRVVSKEAVADEAKEMKAKGKHPLADALIHMIHEDQVAHEKANPPPKITFGANTGEQGQRSH